MSVELRVEEWLRKMGYHGEIPSSLSKICNPTTAFVWEQLISNIKPKLEVNRKRKIIIINRLTKKSLIKQGEFSFPIPEIHLYAKKQELEKTVTNLETQIEEKEQIIEDLLQKNNVTYMEIESIKSRIKENREKTFILEKKSKIFEEDIIQAQERLTLAKNLTPVEMLDVGNDTDEITRTLQRCVEKLEKLCCEKSFQKPKTKNVFSTVQKKVPESVPKINNLSNYLRSLSISNGIVTPSTNSKARDFDKMSRLNIGVNRCLTFSNIKNDNRKETPDGKSKRESLGLLPENCFNTSDDDFDLFLLNSSKMSDSSSQTLNDVFATPGNNIDELLYKLKTDKEVNEITKDLLYKNNRYLIISHCKNIYDKILNEIKIPLIECSNLKRSEGGVNNNDLTELYFIHVKGELEKDKLKAVLKKLHDNVKKKKETILIRNKELTANFELQMEETYLNGVNRYLQKKINMSLNDENGNEPQLLKFKIQKTKEELLQKQQHVNSLILSINKVLDQIDKSSEETLLCVRKLVPYIYDQSWADVMMLEVNCREVEIFKNFPLTYNRHLWGTLMPVHFQLNSNYLKTMVTLLNTPFAPTENILFDLILTKVIKHKLQTIISEIENFNFNYNIYNLQDLLEKEEYVNSVINKLDILINSDSAKEVLGSPSYMKMVNDLWIEMPFKKYISPKRQINGYDYKFYEEIFEKSGKENCDFFSNM